jgi:hypothetical protein
MIALFCLAAIFHTKHFIGDWMTDNGLKWEGLADEVLRKMLAKRGMGWGWSEG